MARKLPQPPARTRVRVGANVTIYVSHGAGGFPPGSEVDVPAAHVEALVSAGHVETIPLPATPTKPAQ
jgi:Ethanolamine utilization protein EutJ (predicted chaperonin)